MEQVQRGREYDEALEKYRALLLALPEAGHERDYLLYHVKPNIEALYLSLVGGNKLELLKIQTEVYALKRKMELMQACLNTGREIIPEIIETILEKEMEGQNAKLREEAKKIEDAHNRLKGPGLDKDERILIRDLYFKLAKLLHPDLHPEYTDQMLALWHQVTEAYKYGDLKKMSVLEIIAGHLSFPMEIPTLTEELNRRTASLSVHLADLISEIEKMKNVFPFPLEKKLNDPEWVTKENNATLDLISFARDTKDEYEKRIALLL